MNRVYKGQILVITLLTLTIVGILVTTIVVITRRDFNQSANSEKYERLYNTADNNLQTLIVDYSKPSSNLATLPTAGIPNATCITIVSGNYYRCNFSEQALTGEFTARTSVFIENKKNIDDYILKKDSALILDITNYLGGFAFSWDESDVALEVAVIFSNNLAFGRLNITRDIYDRNATKVIDSQVTPGFTNTFPFVQNSGNPTRAFTLDISDIFNTPSAIPGYINANGYVPMYLAVIPRSNDVFEEITIDITPDTPASLRNQVREFRSLGEDWNDPRGPKASLITRVPLLPEIPAALLNGITTSVNLVLQ